MPLKLLTAVRKNSRNVTKGFVLLEVVISLVVIAIALTTLLHYPFSLGVQGVKDPPLYEVGSLLSFSSLPLSQRCDLARSYGIECSYSSFDPHFQISPNTLTTTIDPQHLDAGTSAWYLLRLQEGSQTLSMVVYEP